MANKLVNGKVVLMTSEEETALQTSRDNALEFENAYKNIDEEKLKLHNVSDSHIQELKNKASGKQKLKDLGLNDDELKALFGD